MAVVDNITAENSRADLLEGSTTSGLANKFTSGNLENIVTEFKDKINAEISKGLSPKALSLEGRAPLNDIAVEMLARIEVTANDLADAKTITLARGNNHTIREADRFLKEVVKKYGEICKEAKDQASYYNNQATRTEYKDEDGDGKKEEHQVHPKGKITITYTAEESTGTAERITMEPKNNPDSKFDKEFNTVKEAYDKAAKFYDGKVDEAIKFWMDSKNLTIPRTGSTPLAIPNDEKLPYGVQPDAKKIVTGDTRHGTITYINPDGSKVIITEGVNGNNEPVKTHRVINRHGYIDESIIYNKDGSIDHKNKYKYTKIGNGVYQTTQEQYKYTDGEFEKEPSTINEEYGYAYRANGKVEYSKQLPEGTVAVSDYSGTSAPPSETTKTDASGTEYTVVTSEEQLRNLADEGKPFVIKKGDTLFVDRFGTGNILIEPKTGDYYFKPEGKHYYVFDEDGNKVISSGPNGTQQAVAISELDNKGLMTKWTRTEHKFNSSNSSYFESGSTEAGTETSGDTQTYSDPTSEVQSEGDSAVENLESQSDADSTSEIQQEVDSAVETLESQTTT